MCSLLYAMGEGKDCEMKIEKLNPSVKMVTILIVVIMLSFQYKTILNLAVFLTALFFLIFFSDAKPTRMGMLLIPAVVAAFGLFVMGLYYTRGSSVSFQELSDLSVAPYAVRMAMSRNLASALQLSSRLLAFAGMGILFALTTKGESFVRSLMHQFHLSPQFAYGTLAAFHLMPKMAEEYKKVQLAFRTRGIVVSPLSTKLIFTMLVNSMRWSESVAMAMESKGFCGNVPRTYHEIPKVGWYDILFSVLSIGGIVAGMYFL